MGSDGYGETLLPCATDEDQDPGMLSIIPLDLDMTSPGKTRRRLPLSPTLSRSQGTMPLRLS